MPTTPPYPAPPYRWESKASHAAFQEGREASRRDRRDQFWTVADEQLEMQAISMNAEPLAPPEGRHGQAW